MSLEPIFDSFFSGGFECSTHRRRVDGVRLDMIEATAHERFARADYQRLRERGIRTAREGVRWHLVERVPGVYDFSSVLPVIRAARETHTQIIWDLCHYGFPDWLDLFSPEFITRMASFAHQFAKLWRSESDDLLFVAPVNEISFFAWTAGVVGYMHPFARRRGIELKRQLVRAAIHACEEIWVVDPRARITQVDPLINIIADDPSVSWRKRAAERRRLAQYEAWDMLGGRTDPELGGADKYLDIIGVNYYPTNQWIHPGGRKLATDDPRCRLFRDMLKEVYARYGRPLFVAETGIEDEARPAWLRYVCDEVRAAREAGTEVQGICLYPILNHPGWDDGRHCHNGLWDYADEHGERQIYEPLAAELQRQQILFETPALIGA